MSKLNFTVIFSDASWKFKKQVGVCAMLMDKGQVFGLISAPF